MRDSDGLVRGFAKFPHSTTNSIASLTSVVLGRGRLGKIPAARPKGGVSLPQPPSSEELPTT